MARSPRAVRFTCISSVALLIALGAAWQARGHEELREVPFRSVSLGPVAFPTPTVRHFRKKAELTRYVAQAQPGRTVGRVAFPPRTDMILVTTGPRSSTGYSVHVDRVVEERSRVVVHAVERTPRLGEAVRPVVNSPYELLSARALHKPVVVDWQGR